MGGVPPCKEFSDPSGRVGSRLSAAAQRFGEKSKKFKELCEMVRGDT